nr:glycosyltransferase family 4 protein [uncultured Fluviicola sp.]
MKIGIVTVWFERGAGYVSQQYKKILEQEHEVYIYARGGEHFAKNDSHWDDGKITWDNYSYFRVPTFLNLKRFKKWISDNEIEIVFFNEQHWWLPVLLCNEMGIKTGSYIDYYTKETVPFFKSYDFLICNTKRHYEAFSWHPQCFFIPWGTDVDIFKPQITVPDKTHKINFFHSAGFNPYRKGTDLAIKAFDSLNAPEAKLIIHTQVDLGIYFPGLDPVIEKLLRRNQLEILTKTVPAPGLYHLGNVYVYPSRLDGIGLTMSEGLACGLPLIASDCPPMNEFIVEGENGKLVSIDSYEMRKDGYYWPECNPSVDSLKEAMDFYVENADKIETYQQKARAYALENLNWAVNAEPINQLFQSVGIIENKDLEFINQFENNRFFYKKRTSLKLVWFAFHKAKPFAKKVIRLTKKIFKIK